MPKGVSHILHRLWIPGCGKPEILDSRGLRWKTHRKFSTFSTSFPQLWGKRWTSSFWLSFHKGLRRQTPPPSIHAKRIPSNYTAKTHRRKLENCDEARFAGGGFCAKSPLSRSPRKAAKMKGICGRRLLRQKSPPTPTRKPAKKESHLREGGFYAKNPLSRSPRKAAKMKGICGRRLLSQKSPPTPTRKPAIKKSIFTATFQQEPCPTKVCARRSAGGEGLRPI